MQALGIKAEVLRLWGIEKDACKSYMNKDFIVMLQSLMKLEEFEEAEKVLKNGNHLTAVMTFGYQTWSLSVMLKSFYMRRQKRCLKT